MINKKKRTGLDALGLGAESLPSAAAPPKTVKAKKVEDAPKPAAKNIKSAKIAKTTVYVPEAVYEQWRELAFTERKKMHDYLLEGLNMVFQNRGLKSIEDLTE